MTQQALDSIRSKNRELWLPAAICVILLTIELLALFKNTSPHRMDGSNAPLPTLATLLESHQSDGAQIKYRPDGSLVWSAPSVLHAFHEFDAIATLRASATLRFLDDSELVLEPESLLVLERPPQAQTAIALRLVRGSLRRTKPGNSSILLRTANQTDSKAVQLMGSTAVFRVVHRGDGFEIVVESGQLRINDAINGVAGGQYLVTPETKSERDALPPPILKRPSIRILPPESRIKSGAQALWQKLVDVVCTSAWADETSTRASTVEITFSWESLDGAVAYEVEISDDRAFRHVLKKQRVSETHYAYLFKPDVNSASPEQLLYYRVAAVNAQGTIGRPSEIAEMTVRSTPQQNLTTPPPHTVTKTRQARIVRPAAIPVIAESVAQASSAPLHWSVSAGAQVQKRALKNTAGGLPESLQASGLTPARLTVQLESSVLRIYGQWSPQTTTLTSKPNAGSQYDSTLASLAVQRILRDPHWAVGLWGGTGVRTLKWLGSRLDWSNGVILGASASYQFDDWSTRRLRPRLSLAAPALGAWGGIIDATIEIPVWPKFAAWFVAPSVALRLLTIETQAGGALDVGVRY